MEIVLCGMAWRGEKETPANLVNIICMAYHFSILVEMVEALE
jgi:hypothetical protein